MHNDVGQPAKYFFLAFDFIQYFGHQYKTSLHFYVRPYYGIYISF